MKCLIVVILFTLLTYPALAAACERPPAPECPAADQYAFAACQQEYNRAMQEYQQCVEEEQQERERRQQEERIREQQQRQCHDEHGNVVPCQ